MFDNHRVAIGTELGEDVADLEAGGTVVDFTAFGSSVVPLGCSVQSLVGSVFKFWYNDGLDDNGNQGVGGTDYDSFTAGDAVKANYALLLHP